MTKFFFHIPSINVIKVFVALSAIEARHQLMNSDLACYYNQAILLNN
jgi:hypothetical protein